jgi:hypothetical protein
MEEDSKDTVMGHRVEELPSDANETIYIKNLNEKVKLDGALIDFGSDRGVK